MSAYLYFGKDKRASVKKNGKSANVTDVMGKLQSSGRAAFSEPEGEIPGAGRHCQHSTTQRSKSGGRAKIVLHAMEKQVEEGQGAGWGLAWTKNDGAQLLNLVGEAAKNQAAQEK